MSLLRNRNFICLQTGWGISGLGSQLQSFAFALYILQRTGSAMQFAVTLCLQIIPTVLLAPFSGYLADRWNRKRQIVLFDLLSAAMALLFWGIFRATGRLSVAQVYLCVAFLAGLQEFTSTTSSGLMQAVIPPEDFTAQKTVGSIIQSLTAVAGPALGGAVYGAAGLGPVLLANAVSFFACALLECCIRLRPTDRPQGREGHRLEQFFLSQREAIQYVRHNRFLQSFLVIVPALNFIVPATDVGLMTVAQNRFRVGSAVMGVASAAVAVGMAVGALFAGRFGSRRVERMGLSIMICRVTALIALAFAGGGMLLFAGGRILPGTAVFRLLVLVSAVIAGCCGFISVHISAAFMRNIAPEIIGRTSALTGAVTVSAAPLGQVIAGALLSTLPAGAMYLAEGVFSALTMLFAGKTDRKAARSVIIEKDGATSPYREGYNGQIGSPHGGSH